MSQNFNNPLARRFSTRLKWIGGAELSVTVQNLTTGEWAQVNLDMTDLFGKLDIEKCRGKFTLHNIDSAVTETVKEEEEEVEAHDEDSVGE